MSVMKEKPPYTLLEFRHRGDKNFEQCVWAAVLDHCMFGDSFASEVSKALQRIFNNGGLTKAKGHRYYLFQYRNKLLEVDTRKLDEYNA